MIVNIDDRDLHGHVNTVVPWFPKFLNVDSCYKKRGTTNCQHIRRVAAIKFKITLFIPKIGTIS